MERFSAGFATGTALREASFALRPGARLGIVGESGSGKSMLGYCMMGMAPAAARLSGRLTIAGRDMSQAGPRDWQAVRARKAAMIFQEPMAALNPLRRVGATVAEPLRFHLGLSAGAARTRVLSLFEEAGIQEPEARLNQFPHELSGGQRQRVLIALALACGPELLIADEPTTALDANVALRITDLLVRLARDRQMALIFISHDLAAVARATEDIMVMYGGDIVETGPTAEVLATPAHPYTRGLLSARPSPVARPRGADGKRARLPVIPGVVPPLSALPAGCRFAGRCPAELPQCAAQRPPQVSPGPGRSAICHALAAETA